MFCGIRYSKSVQDILNTAGGKAARDLIGLSKPALAIKIEEFTQRQGKWSQSQFSPQQAAIISVAMFGLHLTKYGEDDGSRLAGATLASALMDYGKTNSSADAICKSVLESWAEAIPTSVEREEVEQFEKPETLSKIDMLQLESLARWAADFMVMQVHWLTIMPNPPKANASTESAFAYGLWKSFTDEMDLREEHL